MPAPQPLTSRKSTPASRQPESVDVTNAKGQETMLSYMNPARISKQHKILIETLLFKMIICCGLPWALIDSPYFSSFVQALAPNFIIPDWSFFFTTHLSQEVAAWSIKFKEFIEPKSHLTLSLDGWITGDALKQVISRLFGVYGAIRYSAIAGDGGPNVRAAKMKICAEYPWILNISYKEKMLVTVSGIANYFGQSNYGTFHLDAQRKVDGICEGIKSNSNTRFSSSYQQVKSVNACIGLIKKCLVNSTLKFATPATKKLLPFIMDGTPHWKFMADMNSFIHLLSSGANSILTLERQNSMCADVFYVWVCIAYHLENVLTSPAIGVSHHRSDVIRIYNHRFNQMMTESSHTVFLLVYYLHPSALNIFRGEQIRLKDGGRAAGDKLISQFKLYANNKEPFCSNIWTCTTKPLEWWKVLSRDSNANQLAKVAIKLFSISPSEICDERTASHLGWFNTARRSSMMPENLVTATKLYDYYVNGFTDETEHVDGDLQDSSFVAHSSTHFDIAEFVQLHSDKLKVLIDGVDDLGPGASSTSLQKNSSVGDDGTPRDWSVDSFFFQM
ncbi:hypothetical protein BDN70DRAFT_902068 [Pholiota conissans]|uniref:Uncharacterized protein n=1 Tax=Pholiota conissans TaxID=109636 RepID=A0A9P5YJY9_9AGAR|nr:hypothetical protein BDN70DRAFT_902068 [Pholiota conissans]